MIEDRHRVLKAGCEIGKSGFRTAERMKAAVSINAVIAGAADAQGPGHSGTARPQDVPGLGDRDAARLRNRRRLPGSRPEDPAALEAESLGQALLLVARLGGYRNRKSGGPPGHQTVWEGYARLDLDDRNKTVLHRAVA